MAKTFLDSWLREKKSLLDSTQDSPTVECLKKQPHSPHTNPLEPTQKDNPSPNKKKDQTSQPIGDGNCSVAREKKRKKRKEKQDEQNPQTTLSSQTPFSEESLTHIPSSNSADLKGFPVSTTTIAEQSENVPQSTIPSDPSVALDDTANVSQLDSPPDIHLDRDQKQCQDKHIDQGLPMEPHLELENQKFVLTGLYTSCSRDEMEHHIKRMGGQVMSMVSGRTHYLITGSILENNKPVHEGTKFKKAKELLRTKKNNQLQILSEDEFLKLYPFNSSSSSLYSPEDPQGISSSEALERTTEMAHQGLQEGRWGEKKENHSQVKKSSEPSSPEETKSHDQYMLWSEKYRPKRSIDILGNAEVIRKLREWLTHWHEICILKTYVPSIKSRGVGRFADVERSTSRACMLSGLPGVGKTTAARIIAVECQYDVIEYNSSDDRNKSVIEVIQDMTSGGQTLNHFFSKTKTKPSGERVVLIMDEMDGLSSGDRGGAQALLRLIDNTLCPIICICNDRAHPKVRSIASKCYDLRFVKPPKNTVAKRICEIARQENLYIAYNAAELLCEKVGNDLRQILNTLQLMRNDKKSYNGITFDQMHQHIGSGIKDSQVMTNVFDVVRKLLSRHEAQRMTFNDKLDGYFVDYDLIPLQIQENYISAFSNLTQQSPPLKSSLFETVALVSDAFTFGDMLNRKVRKDGCWNFLVDIGLLTTVLPSCLVSGFCTNVDFSQWLGKNSTTNRNRRLLGELSLYLGLCTTTSLREMQISGYLNVLYHWILAPLVKERDIDVKQATQACLDRMEIYGLTKQHVFENLNAFRFKQQVKLTDTFDASTKRLLTNLSKNQSHALRVNPCVLKAKGKAMTSLNSKENMDVEDIEEGGPVKDSLNDKESDLIQERGSTGHEEMEDEMNGLISIGSTKGKKNKKEKEKSTTQQGTQRNVRSGRGSSSSSTHVKKQKIA